MGRLKWQRGMVDTRGWRFIRHLDDPERWGEWGEWDRGTPSGPYIGRTGMGFAEVDYAHESNTGYVLAALSAQLPKSKAISLGRRRDGQWRGLVRGNVYVGTLARALAWMVEWGLPDE